MAYSTTAQENLRANTELLSGWFSYASSKMVGMYLPTNSPYKIVVLHNLRGESVSWFPNTGNLRAPNRKGGIVALNICKEKDFKTIVDTFIMTYPH